MSRYLYFDPVLGLNPIADTVSTPQTLTGNIDFAASSTEPAYLRITLSAAFPKPAAGSLIKIEGSTYYSGLHMIRTIVSTTVFDLRTIFWNSESSNCTITWGADGSKEFPCAYPSYSTTNVGGFMETDELRFGGQDSPHLLGDGKWAVGADFIELPTGEFYEFTGDEHWDSTTTTHFSNYTLTRQNRGAWANRYTTLYSAALPINRYGAAYMGYTFSEAKDLSAYKYLNFICYCYDLYMDKNHLRVALWSGPDGTGSLLWEGFLQARHLYRTFRGYYVENGTNLPSGVRSISFFPKDEGTSTTARQFHIGCLCASKTLHFGSVLSPTPNGPWFSIKYYMGENRARIGSYYLDYDLNYDAGIGLDSSTLTDPGEPGYFISSNSDGFRVGYPHLPTESLEDEWAFECKVCFTAVYNGDGTTSNYPARRLLNLYSSASRYIYLEVDFSLSKIRYTSLGHGTVGGTTWEITWRPTPGKFHTIRFERIARPDGDEWDFNNIYDEYLYIDGSVAYSGTSTDYIFDYYNPSVTTNYLFGMQNVSAIGAPCCYVMEYKIENLSDSSIWWRPLFDWDNVSGMSKEPYRYKTVQPYRSLNYEYTYSTTKFTLFEKPIYYMNAQWSWPNCDYGGTAQYFLNSIFNTAVKNHWRYGETPLKVSGGWDLSTETQDGSYTLFLDHISSFGAPTTSSYQGYDISKLIFLTASNGYYYNSNAKIEDCHWVSCGGSVLQPYDTDVYMKDCSVTCCYHTYLEGSNKQIENCNFSGTNIHVSFDTVRLSNCVLGPSYSYFLFGNGDGLQNTDIYSNIGNGIGLYMHMTTYQGIGDLFINCPGRVFGIDLFTSPGHCQNAVFIPDFNNSDLAMIKGVLSTTENDLIPFKEFEQTEILYEGRPCWKVDYSNSTIAATTKSQICTKPIRIYLTKDKPRNISVLVRKSLESETIDYSGRQPELVIFPTSVLGNTQTLVLDSMTVENGIWEQLSGTTSNPIRDGYIDAAIRFSLGLEIGHLYYYGWETM